MAVVLAALLGMLMPDRYQLLQRALAPTEWAGFDVVSYWADERIEPLDDLTRIDAHADALVIDTHDGGGVQLALPAADWNEIVRDGQLWLQLMGGIATSPDPIKVELDATGENGTRFTAHFTVRRFQQIHLVDISPKLATADLWHEKHLRLRVFGGEHIWIRWTVIG